jgi:hypothetical protein
MMAVVEGKAPRISDVEAEREAKRKALQGIIRRWIKCV